MFFTRFDPMTDQEVFEKLDRTDNNIGLFLGSTSEYAKEVDKLIFDIDQFKNDIKKNGNFRSYFY